MIGTPSMVKRLKRGFWPAKDTWRPLVELVSSVAKGLRAARSRMSRLTEATFEICSEVSTVTGPAERLPAPLMRDAVTMIGAPWSAPVSAADSSMGSEKVWPTTV